MFSFITFILVCVLVALQLLNLYATHRNKDAWQYGADKLNELKATIETKVK